MLHSRHLATILRHCAPLLASYPRTMAAVLDLAEALTTGRARIVWEEE